MKVFMALPTACLRVLEAALDQRLSVCVWTVKYWLTYDLSGAQRADEPVLGERWVPSSAAPSEPRVAIDRAQQVAAKMARDGIVPLARRVHWFHVRRDAGVK